MSLLSLLSLVPLAALGPHVVSRLRSRRALSALAADLAAEREGAPVFVPERLHIGPGGASLIACDAARSTLHIAARRGARIESARLPFGHVESVTVLENGRPLDAGADARVVSGVTLRVALPDERRSLYDIGFLDRRAVRGSARHHRAREACASWSALLGGEALAPPPGAAEPEVESEVEPEIETKPGPGPVRETGAARGTAGSDARRRLADPYPRAERYAHAGIAVVLCAAAILPLAVSRLDLPGAALAPTTAAAATGGTPALASAEPTTPAGRARSFERDMPVLFERLAALRNPADLDEQSVRSEHIAARIATLDGIVASIATGRSLPLGAAQASRLDELERLVAETRTTRLPRYRRLFALAVRRRTDPVGAWTGGEEDRVLQLARSDLDDALVRASVWESLAEDARRLRFARVDFRQFRSGEVIESRNLPTPPDDQPAVPIDGAPP